jgi:DNA-binding IscR family transcriptional regulator
MEEFCETHTGQRDTCAHADCCTIRPVWSHISDFMVRTLDNVPLSVLTDEEQSVEAYLESLNQQRAG